MSMIMIAASISVVRTYGMGPMMRTTIMATTSAKNMLVMMMASNRRGEECPKRSELHLIMGWKKEVLFCDSFGIMLLIAVHDDSGKMYRTSQLTKVMSSV